MRIAHLLWSLGTGGTENMVADIANEQSKTDDVALFVINDWIEDDLIQKIDRRVHLHLLRRKAGTWNPWPIVRLNVLLAGFRPNIIHTHSYQLVNLVVYPRGKRVRTIHDVRNIPSEYPKFDALISISRTVQEFTAGQGFDSIEIDNGIMTKNIKHEHERPFTDGKLHFVQVSRLDVWKKGQDILLDALAILVGKLHGDGFVTHFIGDGDGERSLREKVVELGLEDYVVFEGRKTQPWVYEHLCDFDLFVQPSRMEGFGLTVAEAMAAKVPVLVSDIEGPMEIIGNGRYGMDFKNENAEDCALKIKEFMRKGKNKKLVEEAYRHVLECYDVAVTAKKYLEVYHQLLKYKK